MLIDKRLTRFFKEDGWFLVSMIIMNLPIAIELFKKRSIFVAIESFIIGSLPFMLVVVLISLFLSKFGYIRRIVQIFFIICAAIIFLTDAFLIYKFKWSLDIGALQILLGTNPFTAKEFLLNYVLNFKIIAYVLSILLLITVFLIKLHRFFNNLSQKHLNRIGRGFSVIFFCLLMYWMVYLINVGAFIDKSENEPLLPKLGRAESLLVTNLPIRTFGYIYWLSEYYPINLESKIFAEMDRQNEEILKNDSDIPNVIFVLGESTTRNHMQLYGYRLETTPLQMIRYNNGELIRFNDVIACANNTSRAMSLIFSFAEKDTKMNDWYLTPNIFDILRRAGYYTVWISNQSPRGVWGNFDYIFSKRCDEVVFTEKEKRRHDDVILPVLDDVMGKPHDKNFYVIHLYETHPHYRSRYPEEYSKFKPEDENKSTEDGRKTTAEYDNAVLYNDYVLNEIFTRFEDKDSVIIHISDHGQEVYDDRNFAGHSHEEYGNLNMIEVPMTVWFSKEFVNRRPEKVAALAAAVDNPYRTDLIIHTILDLMDIHTASFDATKSIFNKNFDKSRPRIYNGKPYVKNN